MLCAATHSATRFFLDVSPKNLIDDVGGSLHLAVDRMAVDAEGIHLGGMACKAFATPLRPQGLRLHGWQRCKKYTGLTLVELGAMIIASLHRQTAAAEICNQRDMRLLGRRFCDQSSDERNDETSN